MMRHMKVVIAALLIAFLVSAAPANAYQSPTFQSDEFNPCGPLDVWTLTTGLAGQSITSNKTHLILTTIPGEDQTIWKHTDGHLVYNVARALQSFGGTGSEDFGAEVKFDSNVLQQFQQQGIVLESGTGNLLRFEFHYENATKTNVYALRVYTASNGTIVRQDLGRFTTDLTAATSLYLKVTRTANVWAFLYKTESSDWSEVPIIQPPANYMVTSIGVFSGTSSRDGMTAPGHTAEVDYFFNTASPITTGDTSTNRLTVNLVGEGEVVLTPPQPDDGYACGTTVQIQANAVSPWNFARFEGALTGAFNPRTLTMDGPDKTVTAVFADTPQPTFNFFIRLPILFQQ
jgi:regulation of enolase protein 1 (concanavalin A-like superfamily)